MRFHFVIAFFLLFSLTVLAQLHVSFHDVVDIHALQSPHASSARLRYENAALTTTNGPGDGSGRRYRRGCTMSTNAPVTNFAYLCSDIMNRKVLFIILARKLNGYLHGI